MTSGRRGKGLGENTIRRRCGIAKQFFRDAVRRRLITENPFGEMKSLAVRANKSRRYFLSREDAARVMAACPNADWRVIFAMARFGGVRVPSEVLAMKWGDVNWDVGRITINSVKTEHHGEANATRVIPLWEELRQPLQAALDELLANNDFDPQKLRLSEQPVISGYRQPRVNLRTQFKRIIKKAGMKPWPKLFQNLRSTRETELADTEPAHVVCAWIGNSEDVAKEHYLQVTAEHYERSIVRSTEARALQIPVQQPPAATCTEPQGERPVVVLQGDFAGNDADPADFGTIAPSTAALRSWLARTRT